MTTVTVVAIPEEDGGGFRATWTGSAGLVTVEGQQRETVVASCVSRLAVDEGVPVEDVEVVDG